MEITKYNLIIGLISSILWCTALNQSFTTSLIIGIILGLFLGLLLALYGRATTYRGNISIDEALFALGSLTGLLGWILIGSGLIAWVVKLIILGGF